MEEESDEHEDEYEADVSLTDILQKKSNKNAGKATTKKKLVRGNQILRSQ